MFLIFVYHFKANPGFNPWTNFDFRGSSSNNLHDVHRHISSAKYPRLFLNSKKEIIYLDKLLKISEEKLVVHQILVCFHEQLNDEFVLHFLFRVLASENLQVLINSSFYIIQKPNEAYFNVFILC